MPETANPVSADYRDLHADTVHLQLIFGIKMIHSTNLCIAGDRNGNHWRGAGWFRPDHFILHCHNAELSIFQAAECGVLRSIRLTGSALL